MPFQYRDVQTAIINTLNNNTATLDDSITAGSPQLIGRGDPDQIPIDITRYPAILVQMAAKSEDFGSLGNRQYAIGATYNVWGFVYRQGSADDSDLEIMNFARNIETVLRANFNLSTTVDSSLIRSTDFGEFFGDSIYLSACKIELEVKQLIT